MISSLIASFIRLLTGVPLLHPDSLPKGGTIYYANHASHLDTLVIWASFPPEARKTLHPVAARDYWEKTALHRSISHFLKCILIERKNLCKTTNPLPEVTQTLEEGHSILIFPEGTRNLSPELKPFKSGIYHLAKKCPGVSLLPIYLNNLSRILPKGEAIPLPLIATVHIGEPLHLNPGEEKASFLSRTKSTLNSLN